jgi:hypothetical protein
MISKIKARLGMHLWVYRNPYDRTCRVCGKHQVEHMFLVNPPVYPWWGTFGNGRPGYRCNRTKE